MRLPLFVAGLALCATIFASAETLTFSGAPIGVDTGKHTEAGYTYGTVSGSIFYNSFGAPGNDVEGTEVFGGGVLGIQAANGSTFNFGGLSYSAYNSNGRGAQTLQVTGLLNGAVVGEASYTLANTSIYSPAYTNWTAEGASTLAGVAIDDLQIHLNAGEIDNVFSQAVDNVVVSTAITPEPTSLLLLGTGLLGLACSVRRRLA